MARYHSKNNSKKSEKKSKNTLIAVISLIVVLVLGSIFFLQPALQKNKYDVYNNFEFEQTQDYWQTHVQYNQLITPITFANHPLDLEQISYDANVTTYILEKPHAEFIIAIRNDSGSVPVIAGINVARILGEKFFGFQVSSALYFEENETYNTTLPVVSCVDATLNTPIIFIDVNAEEKTVHFSEENPNCIILGSESSEKDDVLKLADLLVYKILEIM